MSAEDVEALVQEYTDALTKYERSDGTHKMNRVAFSNAYSAGAKLEKAIREVCEERDRLRDELARLKRPIRTNTMRGPEEAADAIATDSDGNG